MFLYYTLIIFYQNRLIKIEHELKMCTQTNTEKHQTLLAEYNKIKMILEN